MKSRKQGFKWFQAFCSLPVAQSHFYLLLSICCHFGQGSENRVKWVKYTLYIYYLLTSYKQTTPFSPVWNQSNLLHFSLLHFVLTTLWDRLGLQCVTGQRLPSELSWQCQDLNLRLKIRVWKSNHYIILTFGGLAALEQQSGLDRSCKLRGSK